MELHVVLVQFTCAHGASENASADQYPDALGLQSPTPFLVDIPGAAAYSADAADKNGAYQQAVVGSAGDVEMRVYLFSSKPVDHTRITAIANAQHNALTQSSCGTTSGCS
jgi:hypothetical protein